MSKGGSSSAPQAPDPSQTAAAQARANRVNLFSPTGNQLFGNMVANERPEGMTDQAWNALPWDQRYRFEMQPDQASMQIQETPAQTAFRTGAENLAQTMVGRAQTQIGNLPVQSNIVLPDLANGSGRVTRVMDQGVTNHVDGGPVRDSIDRSRLGPDYIRGVNLSALGDYTTRVDRSGLQAAPTVQAFSPNDFSADTARTQGATFGRAMNMLRPDMDLERSRTIQMLADRGIPVGSEAHNAALDRLDRAQANASENAAFSAIGAGSAEQSRLSNQMAQRAQLASALRGQGFQENLTDAELANRARAAAFGENYQNVGVNNQVRGSLFGEGMNEARLFNSAQDQRFSQGMANANLANAAQQQQFSQATGAATLGNQAKQQNLANQMAQRQVQFNELAALMGGPQIGAPPIMQPAGIDVTGPANTAYNGQLAQYNAQMAQRNANLGAAAGLGAAGIYALSSREAKTSKGRIPDTGIMLDAIERLPIEEWKYKPGVGIDGATHIGPMAEDVRDMLGIGDGTKIPMADLMSANLAATQALARTVKGMQAKGSAHG